MCGIGICIDHRGEPARIHERLAGFDRDLQHRGPDGRAFLHGHAQAVKRSSALPTAAELGAATFAITFRQLYVVERHARAVQPISRDDDKLWITLNGEIYNHAELRGTLQRAGHGFHTSSDAEVALAAYQEWGEQCFPRFNGMWAIVIVDLRAGRIVVSRDRLGIKPLYYAVEPWGLVAASEPQAVARARDARPAPDRASLTDFLRGFPPADRDRSFFDGVHAVPAASTLVYALDRPPATPSFEAFWSLPLRTERSPTVQAFGEARDEYAALLDDAVRLRVEADVDVGCLLSGGLDTSTLAATAAGQLGDRTLKAFSIIYRELDMSEIPHIWAVMRHVGLESHTHTLTPREALDLVDPVVRAAGEPLLGQDAIAQYCAYRLAAQHGSTVTLDGQGPDECLGGLTSYVSAHLEELLVTGRWLSFLQELRATARRSGKSLPRTLSSHLVGPMVRPWRHRLRASRYRWLDPADTPWPRRAPSGLERRLHWLITRTNIPNVVQRQDRISMAHGVESRVPFLDHRLVEMSVRLPTEFKLQAGRRKRILSAVARERLPASVVDRVDKKMFVSSSGWIRLRRFEDELASLDDADALFQLAPVRSEETRRFVRDFRAGRHQDEAAVWRLYTAWRWLEALS